MTSSHRNTASDIALPPHRPARRTQRGSSQARVQRVVAAIWEDVLGVERVGSDDEFFALGGDSLLAVRCAARIDAELGITIPLRTFFENSTVAALSAVVAELPSSKPGRIRRRFSDDALGRPHEVSFNQEERLIRQRQAVASDDAPADNIVYAFHVVGPLEVDALNSAVNGVLRRHSVLRTVFPDGDGPPSAVVEPFAPLRLQVHDLCRLPEGDRLGRAVAEAERGGAEPFDLRCGRLLRGSVFQLAADEHVVALTLDHIAADRWSIRVLADEIGSLGRHSVGAGSGEPRPLRIQYADFAAWERMWLTGGRLQRLLEYWKRVLPTGGPIPEVELPFTIGDAEGSGCERSETSVSVSPELAHSVREFSARHRVTVVMTVLAALQVVVRLHTGNKNVRVFSHLANRARHETHDLIGWFANRVVLSTSLAGNPTVRELVHRVRDTIGGAEAHGELPFPKLLMELYPEWYAKPFTVPYIRFAGAETIGELGPVPSATVRPLSVRSGNSDAALVVHAVHGGDSLRVSISFLARRFERASIDSFLAQIVCALDHIVYGRCANVAELTSKLENVRTRQPWRTSQWGRRAV